MTKVELSEIVALQLEKLAPGPGKEQDSVRRTAKIIRKKKPDLNWLKLVLSTVCPDHEIFSSTYVKPLALKHKTAAMVSNPNGFFDDLPLARQSGKIGRRFSLVSKEDREAIRIQKYESQLLEVQKHLQASKERMAQIQNHDSDKEEESKAPASSRRNPLVSEQSQPTE